MILPDEEKGPEETNDDVLPIVGGTFISNRDN